MQQKEINVILFLSQIFPFILSPRHFQVANEMRKRGKKDFFFEAERSEKRQHHSE